MMISHEFLAMAALIAISWVGVLAQEVNFELGEWQVDGLGFTSLGVVLTRIQKRKMFVSLTLKRESKSKMSSVSKSRRSLES